MTDRLQFAIDFLSHAGYPAQGNNLLSVIAWCESERAHTLPPTGAVNNPLDTTEPWEGATDFNSVGVKNYPSYGAGVAASVATLKNGYYGGIIGALKINADPASTCEAIARSPWGSKPSTSLAQAVVANPGLYNVEINTGSAPAPTPEPSPGAPPFPLPASDWYGVPNPSPHNHSGYYWPTDRPGIKQLQTELIAKGYNLGPTGADGYFGPFTQHAVLDLQRKHGLNATGLVGMKTWPVAWEG